MTVHTWSSTALVALATISSSNTLAVDLHSPLIGTWQLVRFEDTDPNGTVHKPYGDHPKGYFVYDATGHLSVQIMAIPAVAKFAGVKPDDDNFDKATDAEVRKAFSSYVAYFGTWKINASGTIVTHIVEDALNPAYTDTDQPRPFKLTGDTLVIEINDPSGHAYRELHRIR